MIILYRRLLLTCHENFGHLENWSIVGPVTNYSVRVEFGPARPNVSVAFGPAGLKCSTISSSEYQMISL